MGRPHHINRRQDIALLKKEKNCRYVVGAGCNVLETKHSVSDRTSGVAAEGWKEAPDAGKVPGLGQPDRRGAGAGYGEEETDEE
jgi:hypothetical protein